MFSYSHTKLRLNVVDKNKNSHTHSLKFCCRINMLAIIILSLLGLASSQLMPREDNVALIVGGLDFTSSGSTFTPIVEIFGCSGENTILVESYPQDISQSSGVYLPDEDVVLHCGGYQSFGGEYFEHAYECFTWDGQGEWEEVRPLATYRLDFILALGPDLDEPQSEDSSVIALGYEEQSDIISRELDFWLPYKILPNFGITRERCLVQHENIVFFEAPEGQEGLIYELDLLTWNLRYLGDSRDNLGRCVVAEIQGDQGLLNRLTMSPATKKFRSLLL